MGLTTRHWLALVLTVAAGASLGAVIGYIVYATGADSHGAPGFDRWMSGSLGSTPWPWLLFGAAIAAALFFAVRLTRSP